MFDGLLWELLYFGSGEQRYPKTDRVRLSISSNYLSHAMWIAFVPPSEMMVKRVVESVERVLQSGRGWILGNALVVEFVHAPLLNRGGGDSREWWRVLMRMGHDLNRRKCLLRVSEDESNLCCLRALVLCRAHVEGGGPETLAALCTSSAPASYRFDGECWHSPRHSLRHSRVEGFLEFDGSTVRDCSALLRASEHGRA